MTDRPDVLVFSDLDGTLLSHDTYRWDAALPALEALAARGGGLVLATSKTAAEVAPLRDALGFPGWPAIVENGAGLLPPAGDPVEQDAPVYRRLRAILSRLPPGFRGFGDMAVDELRQRTKLDARSAELALQRHFTEPGVWTGAPGDLDAFLKAATDAGLSARRGGRFLTLSFGGTKADRMAEIIDSVRPRHTIALGDAPNDVEMLQTAEYGVIVGNSAAPSLPRLPGEAEGRIRRTKLDGPAGWCEAVLDILDALDTTDGQRSNEEPHG